MKRVSFRLPVLATLILFSATANAAQFNVTSDQYARLLDMMQESGVMIPYKKECQTDKDYMCTILADDIIIITYAPDSASNLTAISFTAKAKSVDRVSSLAAVASLSLNKKFVQSPASPKGAALLKTEKDTIERQMMSIILRGGDPTMELTTGGERFYYGLASGLASVRVVPRDWK